MSVAPKIYVIHENSKWLPALRQAFDALATPFEEWHVDQIVLPLSDVPPQGVFYSRMSASNYTRGHLHANRSTDLILRWLEAHGRRVINGSSVLTLVQEKIRTDDDFITRMEFVGGKLIYAVRVYSGGSFELCPADACDVTPGATAPTGPHFEIRPDHDQLLARRLEAFLAAHDIEIAGIEFIRTPDGTPVIYDINTNTNYNASAEKAAGLDRGGMANVAQFLTGELRALYCQDRSLATA